MANKALATRQKMRLRVEPRCRSSRATRSPASPRQRAAGSHDKPLSSERQAAKRALKKVKLEADDE